MYTGGDQPYQGRRVMALQQPLISISELPPGLIVTVIVYVANHTQCRLLELQCKASWKEKILFISVTL